MENKINIAKLLENCPSGMELDCTTWENVILERVVGDAIYIKRNSKVPSFDNRVILNQYGRITNHEDEKCRIFPKGKTTWEGFCKPFKNGDVVATATGNWIGITEGGEKDHSIPTHCVIKGDGTFEAYFGKKQSWAFSRLATEEEKQKLFQVIKRAGYRWNDKTKALEWLTKPIFKKGDKVQPKNAASKYRTINDVCDTFYTLIPTGKIYFTDQDNWELAPNKFDISTLIPFESKVLVRSSKGQCWTPAFFGRKCENNGYITTFGWCQYCIPFEPNIYLMGTTQDCSNFYKTWE